MEAEIVVLHVLYPDFDRNLEEGSRFAIRFATLKSISSSVEIYRDVSRYIEKQLNNIQYKKIIIRGNPYEASPIFLCVLIRDGGLKSSGTM